MQKTRNWRELLGSLISDPRQKQTLASKLGVSPLTLTRWAEGESQPRPQNLKLLAEALPQYRTELLQSFNEEFGLFALTEPAVEAEVEEIPSAFYARVLSAHATSLAVLRFWSISSLILQQAVGQLDPHQVGLAITVVQCMPPSGRERKVRSLRKRIGIGTGRWQSSVEQKAGFLGAESLAGYTVAQGRLMVIQDIGRDQGIFPAQPIEGEVGSAIAPILRASAVAGCLLVSCVRSDFFSSARTRLVQEYADLLALAFEPQDFYELQMMDLQTMPSLSVQEEYFKLFQRRVATLMRDSAQAGRPLKVTEAEQLVWQQLEEELLLLPPEGLRD
jgi:transcriptional regulator with XRE-family HTH domain